MTRVDLDDLDDLATLERVAERAQARDDWATVPPHKILALVAELRAAREVIEAAHAIVAPTIPHEQRWTVLRRTLAAYDQAVAS